MGGIDGNMDLQFSLLSLGVNLAGFWCGVLTKCFQVSVRVINRHAQNSSELWRSSSVLNVSLYLPGELHRHYTQERDRERERERERGGGGGGEEFGKHTQAVLPMVR